MKTKKDFEHQNEYNKNKYDRIGVMLPKGTKEKLQTIAKEKGISLNELIKKAINHYIEPVQDLAPDK